MKPTFALQLAAAACLTFAASAFADDTFAITRADFSTVTAGLKAFDANGFTATDGSVVKMADILSLSHAARADAISGLVLCTVGGDRLVGTPQKLDGQSIVWFASGVGNVTIPLDQCLGVLRDRTSDGALSADRTEDQAKLATGDLVKGIVSDVTDKGFVITPSQGDPVTVPPESISTLLFATPQGGHQAPPASGFVVRVTSGTVITCSAVSASDMKATLTLPGGRQAVIPLQQVASIENASGPVRWLSSRTPTVNEYTPYIEGNFPARFDRSVTGGAIRFAGVTYLHGIGVHSRSKLVFAVEPGDTAFRTRYAIDGNLGYADVDVRVLVDDKVVHAAKGFRAGVLSPIVSADVSGAKTITLEVDYGSGFDVQDRLNWIEPAMLRTPAAPSTSTPSAADAPATQP